LIDLETHRKVFGWVLGLLADRGLLKGKLVGIDATTLEANAAMRSIVRRDNGQRYEAFLTELAKNSGIATPSREDLRLTKQLVSAGKLLEIRVHDHVVLGDGEAAGWVSMAERGEL